MAVERRFRCTACGLCCRGWLPLTLDEALAHAGRFPLAMVWTPLRPGAKAHALATRLGVAVRLAGKKEHGVFVVPTAYIPPSFPCPALADDGLLCSIHDAKPLRCRAMPFYPYREENDQGDLLIPRPGWQCDVKSDDAPVAYRDREIVDPADFNAERAALIDQAPRIQAYAKHVLTYVPAVSQQLARAATGKFAGHVVLGFYLYLSRLKNALSIPLAQQQMAVLQRYADLTADRPDLQEYHQNYLRWRDEMARFR